MPKDNNRTASGRFAPGWEGGPGRPRKDREEAYLQATVASVSLEDWQEIVEMAKHFAKAGDHQARKWLSDNLIGLPTQRVDISLESGNQLDDLSDEQIDKILAVDLHKAIAANSEDEQEDEIGTMSNPLPFNPNLRYSEPTYAGIAWSPDTEMYYKQDSGTASE